MVPRTRDGAVMAIKNILTGLTGKQDIFLIYFPRGIKIAEFFFGKGLKHK
jgi:hypothetical protein